mgnify:CR=1 FL=1
MSYTVPMETKSLSKKPSAVTVNLLGESIMKHLIDSAWMHVFNDNGEHLELPQDLVDETKKMSDKARKELAMTAMVQFIASPKFKKLMKEWIDDEVERALAGHYLDDEEDLDEYEEGMWKWSRE